MSQDITINDTSNPVDDTHIDTVDERVTEIDENADLRWFVLRDLKRANAKDQAYKHLANLGFEVFTPMKTIVKIVKGKRKRVNLPVLSDLLFVHTTRNLLDPIISLEPTIQYRYVRGAYCKPLVVRDVEMHRFIRATSSVYDPKYLSAEDVELLSVGKDVRIIGGALDGIEGKIVNVRGARKRRILVSIPNLIAAVVEVEPEFVILKE